MYISKPNIEQQLCTRSSTVSSTEWIMEGCSRICIMFWNPTLIRLEDRNWGMDPGLSWTLLWQGHLYNLSAESPLS